MVTTCSAEDSSQNEREEVRVREREKKKCNAPQRYIRKFAKNYDEIFYSPALALAVRRRVFRARRIKSGKWERARIRIHE